MDNETFRRRVHREVARVFYPKNTNTHTGLDRLLRENFVAVEGKRIALLTNHAAVDQQGRHIVDLLAMAPDTVLDTLYSPEHGIQGLAEAGEHVASKHGAVPVVSLYGNRREPTREELDRVDLFVVDLQDIGSRYYTYHCTMRRCLKACAWVGKPVLVLDRPNPTGGETLEGPIAVDTSSIVCCSAIPVRHGMTMGELAMWYQKTEFPKLKLSVNLLDGWEAEHLYSQTPLPWIAPSPNMPDPDTALLYVGMCLFEGVNVNEGRGTDIPFQIIGAPWLNVEDVISAIATEDRRGCRLRAEQYTPISIPGKSSNPRYKDELCQGVRIVVDDPRDLRPFTLALAIIRAIRDRHPDQFAWQGQPSFDTLLGGPSVRESIEAGRSTDEIVAGLEDELAAFDANRPKLYDESQYDEK